MTDTTHSGHAAERDDSGAGWKGYANLIAMVLTSTVVMYFFMYLNIYRWEDFWLSETRAYMSTLMGGTMLAIMLTFMLHMYRSASVNLALYALSVLLFAAGLWLVRSQATVQDGSWMKSMIPHHSIAIMVSERAEITDPRAEKLAREIIEAQEKEIAEMAFLIRDIEENGEAGADFPLGEAEGEAPVMGADEALARPVRAALDLASMTDEEAARGLGAPVACTFSYSAGQNPILAMSSDGAGVVMISGALVRLDPADAEAEGVIGLSSGNLSVALERLEGEDAALVMQIGGEQPLRVGYLGDTTCGA